MFLKDAIPHYLQRSITADKTLEKLMDVNIPFEADRKLQGYTWLQCKCRDKRHIKSDRNASA